VNIFRRIWKWLPVPSSLRRARRIVGQWIWRARRARVAADYRRHEDTEVARIRTLLDQVPSARVVTIIATYRRPAGLTAAVESALAQGIADHVVCVVDDGGGLPVLPTDPRLVTVSLSRNFGCLGMVRNVGIRLSDSEYLAFLDDDNTWTPDHLETSLAAHQAGADITYTALHRVLADGSTFDVLSTPFDRRTLWMSSYVDSNALVFRRRPEVVFSRIPRQKEDWALVLRLSRRRHVVHIPTPTVRYLINPESHYTDWKTLAGAGA
jgi:glycosyltransferase involved in cell wall biosynthesis